MKMTKVDIFRLNPGSNYYFEPGFDFEKAKEIAFRYQFDQCGVYRQFVTSLQKTDEAVHSWGVHPFLPIEVFKHLHVKSGDWSSEKVFRSSGTTSSIRSQHLVRSVEDYRLHTIKIFEDQFGSLKDFVIYALLPNYLAVGDSSLVNMVKGFLAHNDQSEPAFFLDNFSELQKALALAARSPKKILLIGVTFALLDFSISFPVDLPNDTVVIETGGMKGRGEELSRSELHQKLASQFQLPFIYSEYGMTELMSQAYSDAQGRFKPAPSMQVSIREINDPLTEVRIGKIGVINIIDLANIHTCAFIATSDLGLMHQDGTFEVVGRLDQSDVRGCHLLYLDF
ncbi:MAG: acyl transferase [Saprospiraceae bacterium]|nr:acyl transferase [Saprospiraceae bacterium]